MHLDIASMPIVPLFFCKLSLSLAVVWGFYQVVLRRMTFYALNRWYLMGYTLLSFFFPLINIGPMLPEGPTGEPVVLRFVPALGGAARGAGAVASPVAGLSAWAVLLWVMAAGSALLLARLGVRWLSLIWLRRKATRLEGLGIRIYQVDGQVVPFSFGNAIYINKELHTDKEWEEIILHEYVHIRQKHSMDILIAELICVVNWYNPFAWLIRHSIRQNLEFIADQEVLEKGVDKKGYQYNLLKVVGDRRYQLANNFNFSSLKKRIVMMNKMRSARVNLLKLLFLLPLVGVLLVAFRDRYAGLLGAHGPVYVNAAGIAISMPDRTPLEGVVVRDQVTGLQATTDARGYYQLRIPARVDSVRIRLRYTKPGYDSDYRERYWPEFSETTGLVDVASLRRVGDSRKSGFFIAPDLSGRRLPAEPGYADAVRELGRVEKENVDLDRYMKMRKDHPEVSLLYITEDKLKRIVVLTDGTYEKYGYPGTPSTAEMDKKYGVLPGFMASNEHPVNSGYLARWEGIAAQAERDFHPNGSNVRAVIFPGDSRVIAVPVSGKPQYYDMDNDAEKERPAFERLYGKLPDCVPKAGNNTDEIERKVPAPRVKDTVPEDSTRPHVTVIGKLDIIAPLCIVDGKKMPPDWRAEALPPDMIVSINVLDPHQAAAVYGEVAKNGAMLITTKDPGHDWSKEKKVRDGAIGVEGREAHAVRTVKLDSRFWSQPMVIIDGENVHVDTLGTLNPDNIESIQVLKDSVAVQKYGEKGKNGVVIIHLKDSLSGVKAPGVRN